MKVKIFGKIFKVRKNSIAYFIIKYKVIFEMFGLFLFVLLNTILIYNLSVLLIILK